jgi:hypothetical protein
MRLAHITGIFTKEHLAMTLETPVRSFGTSVQDTAFIAAHEELLAEVSTVLDTFPAPNGLAPDRVAIIRGVPVCLINADDSDPFRAWADEADEFAAVFVDDFGQAVDQKATVDQDWLENVFAVFAGSSARASLHHELVPCAVLGSPAGAIAEAEEALRGWFVDRLVAETRALTSSRKNGVRWYVVTYIAKGKTSRLDVRAGSPEEASRRVARETRGEVVTVELQADVVARSPMIPPAVKAAILEMGG